jgi:hypothetical protein
MNEWPTEKSRKNRAGGAREELAVREEQSDLSDVEHGCTPSSQNLIADAQYVVFS